MICDYCGKEVDFDCHYPHDENCPRFRDWDSQQEHCDCCCDNIACPECCPECKEEPDEN